MHYYDDLEYVGQWMRKHHKEFSSYEDLADAAIEECFVQDDENEIVDTNNEVFKMAQFFME